MTSVFIIYCLVLFELFPIFLAKNSAAKYVLFGPHMCTFMFGAYKIFTG